MRMQSCVGLLVCLVVLVASGAACGRDNSDEETFQMFQSADYDQFRKDNEGQSFDKHYFVYWIKAKGYFEKLKANSYNRLSGQ